MAPCKRMRCTMCLRIGVVAEGLTAERLGGKRAATCKTCKDMQRWTMRGWSAHANPSSHAHAQFCRCNGLASFLSVASRTRRTSTPSLHRPGTR